ncbi:hypothetical protein IT774_05790 [Salinimonas marina]|uniref:Uncharacterized protein n=1 Tax=Salinimonas marina TaxID=2785918 RepID=A0A7S9DZS0_9ALTE|nr:hypothetical protein [Salinimonas marina]QPG06663.1 hypothetical protein IT774_05790 [Salinimonas marina]
MSFKYTLNFSVIFALLVPFYSVDASEMTKKKVQKDDVSINYHFMDKDSIQKEEEISELVSKAFEIYTELFGGLPRDLSGDEYSEIDIHVKQGKYLGAKPILN